MKPNLLYLTLGLLLSQGVLAAPHEPYFDGPGPHAQPEHGSPWHSPVPGPSSPRPGYEVQMLPPGYQTVLVAGLTYFVLNEVWYQLQGGHYTVVADPTISRVPTSSATTYSAGHGLTQVDINGIRYYVKEGRYYRLNADGEYLEVTPP